MSIFKINNSGIWASKNNAGIIEKKDHSDLKFRHENKFIISKPQVITLENSLRGVMKKDPHLTTESYNIRSIYFDNYYHGCFFDNENGTDPREKFRIRIYNRSKDFIRLELKQKQRLMTRKIQCPITLKQFADIMSGRKLENFNALPELLKTFEIERLTKLLSPDVIVEYDRIPYVYKIGNVRITFDMNISSSMDFNNFFDEKMIKRPVLMTDMLILEVKYDEMLPDIIENLISTGTGQKTTFSKYYLCRRINNL